MSAGTSAAAAPSLVVGPPIRIRSGFAKSPWQCPWRGTLDCKACPASPVKPHCRHFFEPGLGPQLQSMPSDHGTLCKPSKFKYTSPFSWTRLGRRAAGEHEGDHVVQPATCTWHSGLSHRLLPGGLRSSTERVDAPACCDGVLHVAESVLTVPSSILPTFSFTQQAKVQDVCPAC